MFSEEFRQYVHRSFEERRRWYESVIREIEETLKECTPDERLLMKFFYGTMPVSDAGEYAPGHFLEFVRHGLYLRNHVEWCKKLPEDIFIHEVLYYRINNEDISPCRRLFYEQIWDRISGMPMEEATLAVNDWCAEHATYEATDMRTASPETLLRCFRGRCGEESVFAVTALRSVGIPARQVYTPRWAHCDDNHAWVEVYVDGRWKFLGACEPEAALNRGWFVGPASRAVLVHCRRFGHFPESAKEEIVGTEGAWTCYNITDHYADTYCLNVRVTDADGKPVDHAHVGFEVLNFSELYEVASMETDAHGRCRIRMGYGDIFVSAEKDGCVATLLCQSRRGSNVELVLRPVTEYVPAGAEDVARNDFLLEVEPERVDRFGQQTAEQAKEGERRAERARDILRKRQQSAFDNELVRQFPEVESMIRTAGANAEQIRIFLSGGKGDITLRKKLLQSLSDKDYKDMRASVMESHLVENPGGIPEDIYVPYYLCPRVRFEMLSDYRMALGAYLTPERQQEFAKYPEKVWTYVHEKLSYESSVDYDTLCGTPMGALHLGFGNEETKKIVCVSIYRSIGIAARIHEVTGEVQYYRDGRFVSVRDENAGGGESCELILCADGKERPSYGGNWSLGRFRQGAFVTLGLDGEAFEDGRMRLCLSPGIYRLVTTRRKPDGGQQAILCLFELRSGASKAVRLQMPDQNSEPEGICGPMIPDIYLHTQSSERTQGRELSMVNIRDFCRPAGAVTAFLHVGKEPTEHVLNELLQQQELWKQLHIPTMFVLRTEKDLMNETLRKVIDTFPEIAICPQEEAVFDQIASDIGMAQPKWPILLLLASSGHRMYTCAGYNVGSIEQIAGLYSGMERTRKSEPKMEP